MKVWYIESEGPSKDALLKGVYWLLKKSHVGKRVIIAVPAKVILKNVRESMGFDIIKVLKDSGIEVRVFTERDSITDFQELPALVIYPTQKFLKRIEKCINVSDLLVVPHSLEEVKNWLKQYDAIRLA